MRINNIIKHNLVEYAEYCIKNKLSGSQSIKYINRKNKSGCRITLSCYQRYKRNYQQNKKINEIREFENNISKSLVNCKKNLLNNIDDVYNVLKLSYKDRKRASNILSDVLIEMDDICLMSEVSYQREISLRNEQWLKLQLMYGKFIEDYMRSKKLFDVDFASKSTEVIEEIEIELQKLENQYRTTPFE